MNLFFRFLRILLAALLTRRITSLLDMHTIRSAVWLGDQDPMGHMTNSRYSSFTDLAIMNFMGRTRALIAFRKRGWLPVIQYESFFYHRMLRYPQKFEVQTRLIGWEDTFIVFQHDFISGERVHATSLMVARLTGRKKMRVTADMAMEVMKVTLQSPPLEQHVQDILRELRARA